METYRYRLEEYNPETGKHICPNCGHQTFVYYVDTYNNNSPIFPEVGRCERINECRYNLTPWQFFDNYNINDNDRLTPAECHIQEQSQTPKKFNCIKPEHLQKSMVNPANDFTLFLLQYLNDDFNRLENLVNMYNIGSCDKAVIFWQVDHNKKVRAGKIMYYKPDGHRYDLNWYHTKYKGFNGFNMKQCLYGEHLLNDNTKTVFIVESEKTAIILKNYFLYNSDVVVMATGGINQLIPDKFKIFQNNISIICLPDIGAEDLWQSKIEQIKNSFNIDISLYNSNHFIVDALHSNYKLESGQDVADYLIYKHHCKQQRHKEQKQQHKEQHNEFLKSLALWKAEHNIQA